jgi:hypothetical protein
MRLARTMVAATIVGAATLLLAGCPQTPNSSQPPRESSGSRDWVIESVGYSGRRGGPGEHYVTCIPNTPGGSTSGDYREIYISELHAYDETYVEGRPCPRGRVRDQSTGSR